MNRFLGLANDVVDMCSPFAIVLALVLIFGPWVPVLAQRPASATGDLERRVEALEGMQLDHRVTVLEQTLKDAAETSSWSRYSTGGVGLLLLERAIRSFSGRSRKGSE